jgi:RNA polymerase sigma-70 factor (ECF subfamily)
MAPGAPASSPALVGGMARGDRDAFARFYDLHASLVFTFALRLLRDRAEAEEVTQDVFLQAWRQAGEYREERGTPEAWLLTMVRSRGIDKLRSRRRRHEVVPIVDDPEGAGGGAVASEAAASEARVLAAGALAELSAPQREVLELAYFDGLTQTEIAARLGQPLGTVKTRMRSGLERLRAFLGAPPTAAGR